MKSIAIALLFACGLSGCAGSKVSSIPTSSKNVHAVKVIAMIPGGGVISDAVGVELTNRGFMVVDADSTSRIIGRSNLNEMELSRPESLAKLRAQGIDAYLSVKAAGGYDQMPQSASARVNSAFTGRILAGASWQNGWGGMAGSMADRTMRKGLTEAAQDITDALVKSLVQEDSGPLPTRPEPVAEAPLVERPLAVTGEMSSVVDRMARAVGCNTASPAALTGKSAGVEMYQATCTNGQISIYKCELRQCRMMN